MSLQTATPGRLDARWAVDDAPFTPPTSPHVVRADAEGWHASPTPGSCNGAHLHGSGSTTPAVRPACPAGISADGAWSPNLLTWVVALTVAATVAAIAADSCCGALLWAATAGGGALYYLHVEQKLAKLVAANRTLQTETAQAQTEVNSLRCQRDALLTQRQLQTEELEEARLRTDIFGVVLLRSADDLTPELREQLRFAAESEIIAGDLVEDSLLFHGAQIEGFGPDGKPDWNRVGIDLALVFMMNGVAFGYRTLELVRQCGLPTVGPDANPMVLRLNQDIVKPSFAGSALVTMMNLRTSAVIREHLPHCRYVVLEPTTEHYLALYRRKGLAWSQNERGVEHLRAIPAEPRPSCFRTPCTVNGCEQLCGGVKVAAVGHSNDTKAWTAWDEYRSFYCDGLEEYQTLIFEIPQITERGTVGLWYNQ